MTIAWETLRNRPLTRDEKRRISEFYAGTYHDESDYTSHHPWHLATADHRVQLTQAVFPDLGRVLDAGCAGGEEVLAFRRAGIEAFGFDICPDLHDIVYPDVAGCVRIGRMDRIPFSSEDRLRTLVSFDVMEHVPIDCLERFPHELIRLGITQISCIISNDTLSAGHITIQDTDWYVRLFASAGFRLLTEIDEVLQEVLAPVGWNENEQKPIYAPYHCSGTPRNGWNQVPGHLFFAR